MAWVYASGEKNSVPKNNREAIGAGKRRVVLQRQVAARPA